MVVAGFNREVPCDDGIAEQVGYPYGLCTCRCCFNIQVDVARSGVGVQLPVACNNRFRIRETNRRGGKDIGSRVDRNGHARADGTHLPLVIGAGRETRQRGAGHTTGAGDLLPAVIGGAVHRIAYHETVGLYQRRPGDIGRRAGDVAVSESVGCDTGNGTIQCGKGHLRTTVTRANAVADRTDSDLISRVGQQVGDRLGIGSTAVVFDIAVVGGTVDRVADAERIGYGQRIPTYYRGAGRDRSDADVEGATAVDRLVQRGEVGLAAITVADAAADRADLVIVRRIRVQAGEADGGVSGCAIEVDLIIIQRSELAVAHPERIRQDE